MLKILSALVVATLVSGQSSHDAPPPGAKDSRVWSSAEQVRPQQLQLLEQLVNIDSGTGDVEGGRRVAAVVSQRLKALGMSVETIPAEKPGLPENLVGKLSGTGRGRILMIAHMDTVFDPGTARRRPFRTDAYKAYGPGVSDEKGGIVQGIFALELLRSLGFRDYKQIVFLIETSEEVGSPGTRSLIKRLAADADVELNLEAGDPPDVLTVWRKGSAVFQIDVKGRAAHAGVAPQDGRNAALELIHQLDGATGFPTAGPGPTANLTLMKAGTRNNIIPDYASASINLRFRTQADFAVFGQKLRLNAKTTRVPDTTVTVSSQPAFPPLPDNPATEALSARATRIYAGIGRQLGKGGNGGASESALAYEAGVPALDGLGPVGGNYHSDGEYLDLSSLTPRLYLLTKLLMDLGQRPPIR